MRRALAAAGAALALSLLPAAGAAQPRLTAPVTDLADAIPAEQEAQLTQKLTQHRAASGAAVAVLVVPTTAPLSLEAYSMRVATAWREELLGATSAVVYVLAVGDRRHRLEVNDGARARLPDARAREALDAARPSLRAGDWGGAVQVVMDGVLTALASPAAPSPTVVEAPAAPTPLASPPPPAPVAAPAAPQSEGEKVCFGLFCIAAALLMVGLLVSLVVGALYKAGRAISQSFSGGTTYGHGGVWHGGGHGADAHGHAASWFASGGHDHGHDSASSSWSSSDSASSSWSSSDSASSSSDSSSSGGGFSGGGASSDW